MLVQRLGVGALLQVDSRAVGMSYDVVWIKLQRAVEDSHDV